MVSLRVLTLLSFSAWCSVNEARLSPEELALAALGRIGPPWARTGAESAEQALHRFVAGAPEELRTGPLSPDSLGTLMGPVSGGTAGPVILVAGLDYRPGDLTKEDQAELLSRALGRPVTPIKWNDLSGAKAALSGSPGAELVLFSVGCSFADELVGLVKDPAKVWILEPYSVSRSTVQGIERAVAAGVPEAHVVVGPTRDRGLGTVPGASRTPAGTGHFDSLKTLADFMKAR